jgi:hypothetical protein
MTLRAEHEESFAPCEIRLAVFSEHWTWKSRESGKTECQRDRAEHDPLELPTE